MVFVDVVCEENLGTLLCGAVNEDKISAYLDGPSILYFILRKCNLYFKKRIKMLVVVCENEKLCCTSRKGYKILVAMSKNKSCLKPRDTTRCW